MSEQVSEAELAAQLNQRGLFTGAGKPWTAAKVRSYLIYHHLGLYAAWAQTARLTVAQVAQRLELQEGQVRDLIKRGLLPLLPRRLRAGYRIPAHALDRAEVRAAVQSLRQTAPQQDSPGPPTQSPKNLDTREGGA